MHQKSHYSFVDTLKYDVIEALFLQMRASGRYQTVTDIAKAIAERPTTIHFLSYRMARQLYTLHFIEHKYGRKRHNPMRQALYESFIARCTELRAEQPDESVREIIRQAICSPAPHLGITWKSIWNYLQKNQQRIISNR